jgi:hypothetical protein
MANIFPSTLKHNSSPHCSFSVAWGKDKQNLRSESMFMCIALRSSGANANGEGTASSRAVAFYLVFGAAESRTLSTQSTFPPHLVEPRPSNLATK